MALDSLFIVGAGRAGTALALAIRGAGLPLLGLWSRSREGADRASGLVGIPCHHGPFPVAIAEAKIVLLSVKDSALPLVAGALLDGGLLRGARAVLHCCGSLTASQVLGCLSPTVAIGTFHPLLAIARPEVGARQIAGATITVEGDPAAVRVARLLAGHLGAKGHEVAGRDAMLLYHAGAGHGL
jgi:hypothetical protein